MKKSILILSIFIILSSISLATHAEKTEASASKQAAFILKNMSLKEKIGQKLMLDFRYWCQSLPKDKKSCTQDFISMNQNVQEVISKNHIGGVILFANNIKNIEQITTLADAFQRTMYESNNLGLFQTRKEVSLLVYLGM